MTTAEVFEVAVPAAGVALHVTGRVLTSRAAHRAARAHDEPESREERELERVRELFAADRITLAELEDATGRVLRGEATFPPVAPDVWARRETGATPDEAARIRGDWEARRAARERERWRH